MLNITIYLIKIAHFRSAYDLDRYPKFFYIPIQNSNLYNSWKFLDKTGHRFIAVFSLPQFKPEAEKKFCFYRILSYS